MEVKHKISTLLVRVLASVNVFCVLLMLISAFSTYYSPASYRYVSLLGFIFPVFVVLSVLFLLFWIVVKWKMTIISLAGLILCFGSIRLYCPVNIPSAPPKGAIKIMSYNVWHYGEDLTVPWDEKPVVKYIKESGADIVCVQEDFWGNGKNVDEQLDNYPYTVHTTTRKTMLAVFSKYPILSSEIVDYESRSNATMLCRVLIDGDTVMLFNNHLESFKLNDNERTQYHELVTGDDYQTNQVKRLMKRISKTNSIRALQAEALAAMIKKYSSYPIIFCGDFNDTPISFTHRVLTADLYDAYEATGNGPGFSYNRYRMMFRIDHILLSEDWDCFDAKVDKSIAFSDHYPIYVYVKKK